MIRGFSVLITGLLLITLAYPTNSISSDYALAMQHILMVSVPLLFGFMAKRKARKLNTRAQLIKRFVMLRQQDQSLRKILNIACSPDYLLIRLNRTQHNLAEGQRVIERYTGLSGDQREKYSQHFTVSYNNLIKTGHNQTLE